MRAHLPLCSLLLLAACGGSEFSASDAATAGAAGSTQGSSGASGSAGGGTAGQSGAGAGGTSPGGGTSAAGEGGASGAAGQTAGSAGAPSGGGAGAPAGSGGAPGGSAGASGGSAGAPGGSAGAPGGSAGAPGGSAGAPGGNAGAPGGSAGAPGGSAGAPGGSAGAAGGNGCACPSGSYCRSDSGECASCGDLGRLQFGPATRVAGVSLPSSDAEGHSRFPRPTASDAMIYRTGRYDKEKALRFTTQPNGSAGALIGGGADQGGKSESGPWFLTKSVPGFGSNNLVWDRTKSGITGDREIVAAAWTPGVAAGVSLPLPSPLNLGASNYSLAVAEDTGRIFWMSTRSGAPQLLTMRPAVSLTQIDPMAIMLETGCQRAGGDATPWVSADGSLLLFRSFDVTPAGNCVTMVDANDIYAVRLDANGTPAGDAVSLVKTPADETDPALSADKCSLYYAREDADPGGTYEYNIYRAPRQ